MKHYSISELKAQQDQLDARKKTLSEAFAAFCSGLAEGLGQFTTKALADGLRGVKPLTKQKGTNAAFEASLMLNEFDLLLLATQDILFPDQGAEFLAAKLFVYYLPGGEISTPFVEISVQEQKDGFAYAMQWFTTNGPGKLDTDFFPKEKCREAGNKSAEALVDFFYSRRSWWIEEPILGTLRKPGGGQTLGFQVPK